MSESNTLLRPPKFRDGDERFKLRGDAAKFTLYDYWRWMGSDLVSNVDRGIVAEFIVAMLLGARELKYPRASWAGHDITYDKQETWASIEVKSAAYVQSWHRIDTKPTDIRFDIAPKALPTKFFRKPTRPVDAYVFCILGEPRAVYPNPLELEQWEFYALTTDALYDAVPMQKTIGLDPLRKLVEKRGVYVANYEGLPKAIEELFDREPPSGEVWGDGT